VALSRPALVASLVLSAPGGSLIAEVTPHLRSFFDAERSALEADDLDAAVEANLSWWVDGPHRGPDDVDRNVREQVREMQRLAFELTADWDDVPEKELDPPALERLGEVPGLRIFGPPRGPARLGPVSFELDGVHAHDVSEILDRHGVAVRAGHHCAQPLMDRLDVAATARASFGVYTTPEEIDRLIEGLHDARKVFGLN